MARAPTHVSEPSAPESAPGSSLESAQSVPSSDAYPLDEYSFACATAESPTANAAVSSFENASPELAVPSKRNVAE